MHRHQHGLSLVELMVGLALGFPLARYLSGRIGDYRLLIGAFIVYSVASYLCGASETLSQFLPARIAQGIAGGITLPIAQSMLLNEYPGLGYDAATLYKLGVCYLEMNRKAEAERIFQSIVQNFEGDDYAEKAEDRIKSMQ